MACFDPVGETWLNLLPSVPAPHQMAHPLSWTATSLPAQTNPVAVAFGRPINMIVRKRLQMRRNSLRQSSNRIACCHCENGHLWHREGKRLTFGYSNKKRSFPALRHVKVKRVDEGEETRPPIAPVQYG